MRIMEVISTPIADLKMDPANVRKHGPRNIETIVASLQKFGQQKPIVIDKNGVVVAGNGTLAAARQLGWTSIDAVRTGLQGSMATAFAIADNRTAELAEWDTDALAQTLAALQIEDEELARMTGFNDDQIKKTLEAYGVFDVENTDAPELADGDRAPFQQMTFTLHDEQAETIRNAIEKAKADGHGKSDVNENSNGNALAWIAEVFCRG